MNTNWSKILLFSLLSFALGFLVAHCCMRCGHHGGCEGDKGCEMRQGCEHGGMGDMKGDCCKGGMGAMKGGCCKMDSQCEERTHSIIKGLETSNFQGDTTITDNGATIHVSRHGDKMEVKVEMMDSMKVEEKKVEVH